MIAFLAACGPNIYIYIYIYIYTTMTNEPNAPKGHKESPLNLEQELKEFLDKQVINQDNIGNLRRSLFVPWDSKWNGIVRDETAQRELRSL